VTVVPADATQHRIFEEKDGNRQLAPGAKVIIPRRNDLPTAYHLEGMIYIIKNSVMLKQNSLLGENIGLVDRTVSPYVNIDTEEDWGVATRLLEFGNQND